jgi:hypothetical protein
MAEFPLNARCEVAMVKAVATCVRWVVREMRRNGKAAAVSGTVLLGRGPAVYNSPSKAAAAIVVFSDVDEQLCCINAYLQECHSHHHAPGG